MLRNFDCVDHFQADLTKNFESRIVIGILVFKQVGRSDGGG